MWLDVTTNKWNVFEDACPHRLAPLSEGRIEPDGTLLCTYHAWRFNAKGECTSIPHAKKETEARLKAIPKACAIQHPVQEAQGLLWVWGEAGAPGSDAAIEAALKVRSRTRARIRELIESIPCGTNKPNPRCLSQPGAVVDSGA